MLNNNEVIAFAHVPKCGGKSFKKGLESAYGEDMVSYYVNPLRHRAKDALDFHLWRIKKSLFPKRYALDAKIIYGHFCFDDLVIAEQKKVLYGAFFRDPVEWFGSYYFYHHNKYPGEFPQDPLKVITKMDLSKAFQKYIGNIEIEEMAFVGITEHYELSLQLFSKVFGKTIPYYFENKTEKEKTSSNKQGYRSYFQETGILDQVVAAMSENEVMYARAIKRFEELCANYELDKTT